MRMLASRSITSIRVGLACLVFLGSALASMPWEAWAADSPRPAAGVSPVTLSGRPLERPVDPSAEATRIATAFLETRITIVTGDSRFERSRRELGVTVDEPALRRWLAQAWDADSALADARASAGAHGTIELVVPATLDPSVLVRELVRLGEATNRRPSDARFDVATGGIADERPGLRLDVDATLDAVRASFDGDVREIRAVIREVPARRTRAMLAGTSAAAVLGDFETRYNPAENAADRTHNLKVAASRIDGTVVLPGETFDFNEVVGERSEARGFRAAPVIEAGEIDLGVGGGTCQISGTLHAAVFFSGMPILDRLPHSRPSSYIKLGLDAMVTWPEKNFRFRNDLPHPVVLRVVVRDGTVRAEVRGASRNRMVSFVRRVDSFQPYEERLDDDPTLPMGVRVLVQRGMPGFRLTRFRVVRDMNTQHATRERMRDSYPPTTQIWRVGTGGPIPVDYVPPPNDSHPEYRADELLEIVEGPGIEGFQEFATAGRTGLVGWTRAMGMPFAE